METVPLDVCCLKIGDKYSYEYVNNLFKQVEKTTPGINNFICYTDNKDLLNDNISVKEFKPVYNERLWWNKVLLLDPDLHENKTMFLDLDVYVHNNLFNIESGRVLKTNWFNDDISSAVHGTPINSSVLIFDRDEHGQSSWMTQFTEWCAYGQKLFKCFYGLDTWLYRKHFQYISNDFIDSKYVYSYKWGAKHPEDVEAFKIRSDRVIGIFDDSEDEEKKVLRKMWNDT